MTLVCMEAIQLCWLPNKLHLLRRKQHRFTQKKVAPLHVYFMFRPFLRLYFEKEVKYVTKLFQGTNVKSEEGIF